MKQCPQGQRRKILDIEKNRIDQALKVYRGLFNPKLSKKIKQKTRIKGEGTWWAAHIREWWAAPAAQS